MWHLRGNSDHGRAAAGRSRSRARPDERCDGPSRPERPRHARVAGGLDRGAAPQHHRRRGRPSALLERGRHDLGRPERRALQPRLAPRRPAPSRAHVREPVRHRDPAAPLRGVRPDVPDAAAGDVRRRRLGPGAPARCDRARPTRDQADLLRRLRRLTRLRVGAQELARERARAHRSRLRGDRRLPLARLLSRACDAAGSGQEARARLRPRDRGRHARAAALLELPGADARARRQRRGVERAAAGRARGVGAPAVDERRAARRDALRRPRLEPDRRADGEADGPTGADVRGRLRGGRREQRARGRPLRRRRCSAPSTTSSSSRSPATRSRSTALSGIWTSRSPTCPRSGSSRCPASRRST